MAFSIKNPETDRLARRLAKATGESLTTAVDTAVRERLERVKHRKDSRTFNERVEPIIRRLSKLPTIDHRSADEIIGYDENGLPT